MRAVTAIPLILAATLMGPGLGRADEPAPTSVESLAAPSFPASVFVNAGSASVDRPTSPKKVALGLLSGLQGSQNYAMETTPYLWNASLNYGFMDYYNTPRDLYRNFAVSVTKADLAASGGVSPAAGTSLGIGARTLWSYYSADRIDGLTRMHDQIHDLMEISKHDLRAWQLAAGKPASITAKAALDAANANVNEADAGFTNAVTSTVAVLTVEPGGGLELDYPGNDATYTLLSKAGGWMTVDYTPELLNRAADFIGVYRVIYLPQASQTYQDFGGRFRISSGDWALSVELLKRVLTPAPASGDTTSLRRVGILEYRVNPDQYLTLTYGQDNPNVGASGSPLVAMLGASIGFGPNAQILH